MFKLPTTPNHSQLIQKAEEVAGRRLEWVYQHDIRASAHSPIRVCTLCGTIHANGSIDRLPPSITCHIGNCTHDEYLYKPEAWNIEKSAQVFILSFERCVLCGTWSAKRLNGACPSCHKRMGLTYEGIGYNGEHEDGLLIFDRASQTMPSEVSEPDTEFGHSPVNSYTIKHEGFFVAALSVTSPVLIAGIIVLFNPERSIPSDTSFRLGWTLMSIGAVADLAIITVFAKLQDGPPNSSLKSRIVALIKNMGKSGKR